MAAKKKATVGAETEAKVGDAQKFTVEKLQANCRQLFGVTTSTFAGATYGMTGKYTVDEMNAYIKAWKKKGVK